MMAQNLAPDLGGSAATVPSTVQRFSVIKKKILFCVGAESINNAVIVSSGQQRHLAIHIHVSILPQIPLPSRLIHNIEQTSLCYTVGPCWLFILNIAVYRDSVSFL